MQIQNFINTTKETKFTQKFALTIKNYAEYFTLYTLCSFIYYRYVICTPLNFIQMNKNPKTSYNKCNIAIKSI